MSEEFHRWLDRREWLKVAIAGLIAPLLITAALCASMPWDALAALPVLLFVATRSWYLYRPRGDVR